MTLTIAQDLVAPLEREEFREAVERLCVSEWHWGAVAEVQIEPIRAHRQRCTVAITLKTQRGRQVLIGKVYSGDRSDVFRLMRGLCQDGFGPEAACSIPRPLAWLPVQRVRLEEKVDGPSVREVIPTGGPADWTAAAARSGEWLGRFHRTAPKPENGRDLAAKLAHNGEATTCMTKLRHKAELLLAQLEEAAPHAAAVPRCAGHGSYLPEHVFLSDRRTVVIDLDEHDAADPSRDVAWFLVALQRRAIQLLGSRHALDGAADGFVEAYSAAGPPGALANLRLYRALTCLSRARRDLYRQAPDLAEFMVDEALRLMASH